MDVNINYKLHISNAHFVIEPLEGPNNKNVLVIDRQTHHITLKGDISEVGPYDDSLTISGIVGVVQLLAGPYLIVISDKQLVGEINGQQVWKVASTKVLSYTKTTNHLNETQIQDNNRYLAMLDYILGVENFYFSASYDVTHTMQRLNNTSPDFTHMPLCERGDARFIWNNFLLRDFTQQSDLYRYCIPLMLGFISIQKSSLAGNFFTYAIISRRSCLRAGTRYYVRGVDGQGHSANYVETEQIVEYENQRCSYVQTRGSVPMLWSQYPNLKYKPDPYLEPRNIQVAALRSHFNTEVFNYGNQVIVNLLDHNGQETNLYNTFKEVIDEANVTGVRHEPFDFHRECSKMRWHRLSLLSDRLQDSRTQFGYFHSSTATSSSSSSSTSPANTVIKSQTGVFRTNCIDCLDRTNVVQSMFAKGVLAEQLVQLGVCSSIHTIESSPFENLFNNVWADNADQCAVQYAGTGALKTDFTRTGKRTIMGCVQDGYNSAVRYCKNNFYDGFRQDSIDLLLGNYIVDPNEGASAPSIHKLEREWKYYALPGIALVALAMLLISLLIPSDRANEQMLYIVFWLISFLATLLLSFKYGIEFVDRPRLVKNNYKNE